MKLSQTKGGARIGTWFHNYMKRNFDSEILPWQKVLAIYIPLLVDQAFLTGMNLINSSMVSSSGAEAVSAVSMVDSLNFFLTNLFIAIATGGTVVVAQYIGKGDKDRAARTISQAVTSSVLIAVVIAVIICIFPHPTLTLLFGAAEPKILDNAYIYLVGSAISYPFYAIYQASAGALRGSGDTKASMVMSVIMNCTYLIGNIILIQIMNLGVLGVSIAMVFSRILVSILALVYLLVKRSDLGIKLKHFFTFDGKLQKSILYIGIPAGTEQLFFNGGKILVQTFVVLLGTMSITANAIGNNLLNMWQIPMFAAQLCTTTIIGQCVGAGQFDTARKYLKSINRYTKWITGIMMAIFIPLTPVLLSFFHPPAEAAHKIYLLLLIPIIGLVTTWPASFITPNALRAAGDATFTTVAALISMWSIRVVLGYVLGIVCRLDIYGVWLAMCIEWCTRAAVFTWRFKGTKWQKYKLV